MKGFQHLKYKKLLGFLLGMMATPLWATQLHQVKSTSTPVALERLPGFFRFSFDNITMPKHIQNMGLLGLTYFGDITPVVYGGVGGYASVTGSQGGLFVLGFEGGVHKEIFPRWWGDMGLFLGGGGGRSSLVGGGFMLRPHVGIAYDWHWVRLGLHYSYLDFPTGKIHSSQLGLDLDIPWDFYYVPYHDNASSLFHFDDVLLPKGKYLELQRNDFALLLQAYKQKRGTLNVNGQVQDGTIGLVGAELDHYMTENVFWSVKTSGAYRGIPNGYMDVLGGVGYHWSIGPHRIALVPQFNLGAGGGGNVDTGGGVLIQPQLGIEIPLTSSFATRFSGGYLWAPDGNLRAISGTGELIYHLDIAREQTREVSNINNVLDVQNWRIELFNQTYLHPQRSYGTLNSAINLIVLQFDQLFTQNFFFSYQAASAYQGEHAGGYATGMIGPGLQTPPFLNHHLQLFTEVLVGAGGGGSLALGGGELIEPVVGVHCALTPAIGIQTSVSQVKAFHHSLNTMVFNLGLSLRFGMLERA